MKDERERRVGQDYLRTALRGAAHLKIHGDDDIRMYKQLYIPFLFKPLSPARKNVTHIYIP